MQRSGSRKWFARITKFQKLYTRRRTLIATRLTLCLALLSQTLLIGVTSVSAQVKTTSVKGTRASATNTVKSLPPSAQESDEVRSERVQPAVTRVINFKQLAEKARRNAQALRGSRVQKLVPAPAPMRIEESPSTAPAEKMDTISPPSPGDTIPGPLVPSPAPSAQFQGEIDQAKGGGPAGTFTIPPDTMGAVGLDKVFVTVNNNYKVQDKAIGTELSLMSIDDFWVSTGATGVFDPRVQYDPYNNRWLLSAVSNAQTANSSVLVGVSETSDPEGTYFLFRFIVGSSAGAGEWADFPMLGFNKNWVAVGWNPFTITTSAFIAGKVLVLDYPTLRTNVSVGTIFSGISAANGGFCVHPATTFSTTENTLYAAAHQSSAGATYRLHTITGTPAAPSFTIGTLRTRTGGGWSQPGGDVLPQQCIPGVGAPGHTCPVTLRGVDVTDAFIRSNVVFRNGKIYYPQAINLPAGGGNAITTRYAAQWTALNPDGTFFDGGRVEDATATRTNGGKHYAFPSIAVNKNNDILFGFSEYESDDYVDAGYTFRLGTDAPGTMQDPFIYKEGEDYYEKTFGGANNRWGDYSHSAVDPVNDRDLWTIQEYAGLRVGTTGQGSNDSRWATWWAKITVAAGAGELIISEFRVRGLSGANDEFIEIYNNSGSDHTVAGGGTGYGVAASDGVARCVIPNGTVIPNRGHYLCVNSVAYSLAAYPAGNGTTATGDATYTTDIPDNAGIAIFNTSVAGDFNLATRLDAVGSVAEANTLYKEGTGYPTLTPFSIDYSFVRSLCPGNTAVFGSSLGCFPGSGGLPKDSDANQNDFVFVDTNGTSAGAGQRLGAPGPENLSSPIQRNSVFGVLLLDATVGGAAPPNRVRDLTSDPPNNSTFGTLDIRRRIVNNTGGAVTRLRFRVIDITTFPAPSGFADLRTRTSTLVVVAGVNDAGTCSPAPAPCMVNVQGTTNEAPPSQPNGGAFDSSYSAGTVTLATPLADGASINVRFLLGIQQTGNFRFFLNVEALP